MKKLFTFLVVLVFFAGMISQYAFGQENQTSRNFPVDKVNQTNFQGSNEILRVNKSEIINNNVPTNSIIGINPSPGRDAVSTGYSFSTASGTFQTTAPSTATVIASGYSSAIDDANFSGTLPFTFIFNGTGYTAFTANTNGFISFGATAPTAANYGAISSSDGYSGCIAAMSADLFGYYNTTSSFWSATCSSTNGSTSVTIPSGSNIKPGCVLYNANAFPSGAFVVSISGTTATMSVAASSTQSSKTFRACGSILSWTQGTNGSRYTTIRYSNFAFYNGGTLNAYMYFDIILYEGTNKIDIVYGTPMTTGTAQTSQIGLRGVYSASTPDFNNRTATTSWTTTGAGGTTSATMTLSATVYPASGQTYTWTPPTAPSCSISPTSYGFGYIPVGSSSGNQTFTITNTGTATMNVSSVALSGTNSADFVLTDGNSYPKVVAPGANFTVTVNFTPLTNTGSKTASLTVTSDASNNPQSAALTGSTVPLWYVWNGAGVTGGTGGTDFNAAANWKLSSGTTPAVGPGATDSCVVILNAGGSGTAFNCFKNTTVGALTINITSQSNTYFCNFYDGTVPTAYTFTVNGDLSFPGIG